MAERVPEPAKLVGTLGDLQPPPPPNHRLWWIVIGGGTGTAILLAAILALYLQGTQSTPPPDGWQAYFAREFATLRASVQRVEHHVLATDPRPPMWGCVNPYNPASPWSCATPIPTPRGD